MEYADIVRIVYAEGFSLGRLELLDDYLAADYVNHQPVAGVPPGLPGLKQAMRGLRAAFADLQYTVEDLITEADRVAVRATMSGTHTGPFRGQPPTGRKFTVLALAVLRFEDGKVVERWGLHDVDLMAAQLAGDGAHEQRGR
jgi:predicted ester cyclase